MCKCVCVCVCLCVPLVGADALNNTLHHQRMHTPFVTTKTEVHKRKSHTPDQMLQSTGDDAAHECHKCQGKPSACDRRCPCPGGPAAAAAPVRGTPAPRGWRPPLRLRRARLPGRAQEHQQRSTCGGPRRRRDPPGGRQRRDRSEAGPGLLFQGRRGALGPHMTHGHVCASGRNISRQSGAGSQHTSAPPHPPPPGKY